MIKWLLAAFVLLATPGLASAQVLTSWTEADARRLIEAENGVVLEVSTTDEGELEVLAKMDDWLNVLLIGDTCRATAGKTRCEGLAFHAFFEIDDTARALQMERELSYEYVADLASDGDLIIHRQVELGGGASFANIRAQLSGFVTVAEGAADRIWPPDAPPTGAAACTGKNC